MLYLKSELTEDRWRIYSDNIAMARWLQSTVQGMLNAETADTSIPVTDADSRSGRPALFLDRELVTHDEEIALTWYDIGEPLLIHTQPNATGRPYGVCTVLIPALGTRLTRNGVEASAALAARARGRPFSTCALAFSRAGPRRGSTPHPDPPPQGGRGGHAVRLGARHPDGAKALQPASKLPPPSGEAPQPASKLPLPPGRHRSRPASCPSPREGTAAGQQAAPPPGKALQQASKLPPPPRRGRVGVGVSFRRRRRR